MTEPPRIRITTTGTAGGLPQTGFFGRFVALTAAGLLIGGALVAAITFSLILLPIVLTVGAIGFGYLWFKTRGVRKQLKEQMQAMQAELARQQGQMGSGASAGPGGASRPSGRQSSAEGEVIDGDFIKEAPSRPDSAKR
ncbi:MAG: hypothetical protein AB8C46_17975 [Burkholderiaceae bacterium]